MQEFFSCRNCIHNAGQAMSIGRGPGYCMKHLSVIKDSTDTTCKYQHRKDLPHFVVDEARSEHAAEFAGFTALVSLSEKKPLQKTTYSEKFDWERRSFDPITNALASYHKAQRSWVVIQSFAGGVDGQRALVHSCLTRRYLDHCGTWTSSYRMVLALVDEMQTAPVFDSRVLNTISGEASAEVEAEARWDVFFARLTGLQEYGWHAGLEELMWASDGLNGSISNLDWSGVNEELRGVCPRWIDILIEHACQSGEFFSQAPDEEAAGGVW